MIVSKTVSMVQCNFPCYLHRYTERRVLRFFRKIDQKIHISVIRRSLGQVHFAYTHAACNALNAGSHKVYCSLQHPDCNMDLRIGCIGIVGWLGILTTRE